MNPEAATFWSIVAPTGAALLFLSMYAYSYHCKIRGVKP